jgi:hypothetical protein
MKILFLAFLALAFVALAGPASAGGYWHDGNGWHDHDRGYADHRQHQYRPSDFHSPPVIIYDQRPVYREVRYREYYHEPRYRSRYVYREPRRQYGWDRQHRHHRGCRHW